MPTETLLVTAGIVAMFLIFGLTLAYVSRIAG